MATKNISVQLPDNVSLGLQVEETILTHEIIERLKSEGFLNAYKTYAFAVNNNLIGDKKPFRYLKEKAFLLKEVASTEEQLRKKRAEIKLRLLGGNLVCIDASGNVQPSLTEGDYNTIMIPKGKLATDDDELKKKREQLRKNLKEGKKVVVEKSGRVNPGDNSKTGDNIQIPPGKLAFYWYDDDPELFKLEKAVMNDKFPQFKLDKFASDGRLYWHGTIEPEVLGGTSWYLQLVYDNNHPHNNSYGGSVKVYSIEPDLDELVVDFREAYQKSLPHILTDTAGHKYMCTSEKDNFHASKEKSTSAASCLAWAIKWITCYEILIADDNPDMWEAEYEKFATHGTY